MPKKKVEKFIVQCLVAQGYLFVSPKNERWWVRHPSEATRFNSEEAARQAENRYIKILPVWV